VYAWDSDDLFEAINDVISRRDECILQSGGAMTHYMRYVLFFVCAVQSFFAIAFFLRWPVAVNLWPFPGTTPLTFIFVASIFAASAAATLWVAATKHYGALAGIGLDYVTILVPASILSFQLGGSAGNPKMTAYAFACVIGALFGLGLFLWSMRFPLDRTLPMPRPVRWSFVVALALLLLVGGRLVFKVPNSIPWTITPDLSVIMGAMFLGAAVYFAYGLLRPSWLNAAGQMAGFLAYDVVLIVPFLQRLPRTSAEHLIGLIIYTGVVAVSGLIAIFYLFIHKPTRLWA
jgi:hypothetical protein